MDDGTVIIGGMYGGMKCWPEFYRGGTFAAIGYWSRLCEEGDKVVRHVVVGV